jgi:hypothetical protein
MSPRYRIPYNHDDAWPAIVLTEACDWLGQLQRLGHLKQRRAYHGAYRDWKHILSSLDICFKNKNTPANERVKIETGLLETFAEEAEPHLSPEARRHIELAHIKWNTRRNTGTAFVGRHYGLPTRSIDWTFNCLTALFFACRRDFNEPGVIWWMSYDDFSAHLAGQWPTAYGRTEDIADDFERDFIAGTEKGVLSSFFYPPWMERPRKQEAWITLADQYAICHAEKIHGLGVRDCGRLIVTPVLKRGLLTELSRLGISGTSLGLGDACVEMIAEDVAQKFADGGGMIGCRSK